MIGADTAWSHGLDGSTIGVAMIDSGISAVSGTDTAVVHGPDFTGDAATAAAHVDGVGHGTHLAGIVAGRTSSTAGFRGIAPGARLVDLQGPVRQARPTSPASSRPSTGPPRTAPACVSSTSRSTAASRRQRSPPPPRSCLGRRHRGRLGGQRRWHRVARLGRLPILACSPSAPPIRGSVAPEDDRLAAYSSRGDAMRQPDVVAPAV